MSFRTQFGSWSILLLLACLGFLGVNCGGGGSAEGGRAISVGPGLGGLTVTRPNPGTPGAAQLSGSIAGDVTQVPLVESPLTVYTVELLYASGGRAAGPVRAEPVSGQSAVSVTFRDLLPGNYEVSILSYDADGRLVGRGESPVEIVVGQVSSVSVSVTPVSRPSPSPSPTPTAYILDFTWGTQGDSSLQFNHPHGIASNPDTGDIYVYDSDNRKIKKYHSDGTWVNTFGPFLGGRGLAVCQYGNLVFGDYDDVSVDRALEFEPSSSTVVRTWGSRGTGDGQFRFPVGVAASRTQDRVYVLDYHNQRVQAFNLVDGAWIFDQKWGTGGTGDGQFNNPEGICTDAAGNVYVADSANDRIQKFTSTGTHLLTFGGRGSAPGRLYGPNGVTVDSEGCIYVAEFWNNRVQKFSPGGTSLCTFGDVPGTGQLNRPYTLTWCQGRVYVSDTYNHRVVVFKPAP